jgi:uncharacterized membrane protein
MDRMLVVVFDDEAKAYEGKKALLQLDGDGSVSIYRYAVVTKHGDGTTTIEQEGDSGPVGNLAGTSLGSFIGRLGEPTGLSIGAAAGTAAGATAHLNNASIEENFIDDVTKVLLPNRVAVVAEIAEEWTTPVDMRMERIGGIVFRWMLSDVKHMVDDEDVATRKTDVGQMTPDKKCRNRGDQNNDPAENDLPSNVLLGE